MNLPESVKIGYKDYKVQHASPDLFSKGGNYGVIDYSRQVITLNSNNTQEQDESTLLHEVLHGIEDMYELDLGEHDVSLLANALYAFYKDNIEENKYVYTNAQCEES